MQNISSYGVLGQLEIRTVGGGNVSLLGERQRALLALLIARRGEFVGVDTLAGELFAERPPLNPTAALQSQVSRLRRTLGDGAVVSTARGYALRAGDIDVARFEALLVAARQCPAEAADLLTDALALWRGPAYHDFTDIQVAQMEAIRLEALRLVTVEEWAEALTAAGRAAEAVPELERFVAEHPLRERAHATLMRALYLTGRHADALRHFRCYRKRLADELGLEPSTGLQRLELDILRHSLGGPGADEPARTAVCSITLGDMANLPLAPWQGLMTSGRSGAETKVPVTTDGHRPRVSLGVLGPLEVRHDGRRVEPSAAKLRALLIDLVVHRSQFRSSSQLIADLWGDSPPSTASGVLQNYLSQLRDLLGPEVLIRRGGGYGVDLHTDGLDSERFERFAAQARVADRDGDVDAVLDLTTKALALWRGQALVDVSDVEFARPYAARLGELRDATRELQTEATIAAGRPGDAIATLEEQLAVDPLRERSWWLLMVALHRSGRQADALRAYQRARSELANRLGIDPGAELRELELAILSQRPELDDLLRSRTAPTLGRTIAGIGATQGLRRCPPRSQARASD